MADEDAGPRAPHQHPLLSGASWPASTRTSRTSATRDYEFTVTFARVDHEVEAEEIPGVVVSRVNLVPQFMRELIDAMEDNYSKWRTREGIRNLPERPDEPPTLGRGRDRRAVAGRLERERDPLHRRGVAAVSRVQRGGSGSPTFWRAIRRWKATKAGAPPARRRASRSARTSTARESRAALGPSRADTARAGQRERREGRGARLERSGGGGDRRGRGDDGGREQPERPQDVAVADVGELVGHHQADLLGREVAQQGVEQDDAAGRAQAADVGVRPRRLRGWRRRRGPTRR